MMEADNYWDSFYAADGVTDVNSQFATFCLAEYPECDRIVDVGCGNGRDSLHFSRMGKSVLGVDSSYAAIQHCKAKAGESKLARADFVCCPVEDISRIHNDINQFLSSSISPLIYSRFFLHAISKHAQVEFIRFIARSCKDYGARYALEFRIVGDESGEKTTAPHFRRYVDPQDLRELLKGEGLTIDYQVSGQGMAKYKTDDALVCRIVGK